MMYIPLLIPAAFAVLFIIMLVRQRKIDKLHGGAMMGLLKANTEYLLLPGWSAGATAMLEAAIDKGFIGINYASAARKELKYIIDASQVTHEQG